MNLLLDRLMEYTEMKIVEELCGSRKDRSSSVQIFCVRHQYKLFRSWEKLVHMALMRVEQAHGGVDREVFW